MGRAGEAIDVPDLDGQGEAEEGPNTRDSPDAPCRGMGSSSTLHLPLKFVSLLLHERENLAERSEHLGCISSQLDLVQPQLCSIAEQIAVGTLITVPGQ
jgi:hypothetical protein